MKTTYWIAGYLIMALYAFGQDSDIKTPECDCPDCRNAAKQEAYVLPGLEETNSPEEEHDHEQEASVAHEHEECEAHDHDEESEQDHDENEAHEHAVESDHDQEDQEDHEGHDHAAHDPHDEGDALSAEMSEQVGIRVQGAVGGPIAKSSVFPAEIKLNRDRMAGVSPRYDSVVRQVFVEIGDDVRKGDILASLENRETMAVYSVSAPLDGTVISKDLSVGETVETGKVLYEVANLDTVWADISIFPQYQHLIKRGMAVEFVAHDGHSENAMVKYISPLVSHETRTFTARCVLTEAGADFTPGAFVRARIDTEKVDAAVRIEREAVQTVNGETVVFVPGDHGYESVDVEVGLTNKHFAEIKHGLKPGDPYVVDGAFTLKAELITSGMDPHAGHNH